MIEEIRYDAEAGEVAITFRPGGVWALAREEGGGDGVSKATVTRKTRKPEKKPDAPPVAERGIRPVSRAAMLALAYHVERLIEDGTVASYAGAARGTFRSKEPVHQLIFRSVDESM